MPGDVPIRKNGDGRFPVPGWTGEYDWTGFIPFDQLPYSFNPPRVISPQPITRSPRRVIRISSLPIGIMAFAPTVLWICIKNAPGKIDLIYIQKMQGDMYDANAATVRSAAFEIERAFVAAPIDRASRCSRIGTIRRCQARRRRRCSRHSGAIFCKTHSTTTCPRITGQTAARAGTR